MKSEGRPVGPTLLYFGCRNKDHDYIYQELKQSINQLVKMKLVNNI